MSSWSEQAVGIVGGAPKCGKSLCALSLAVSVASGAPCLGRYQPAQTGRVLLYAAEDPLELVRDRLVGICRACGQPVAAATMPPTCSHCGAPLQPGIQFCANCGQKV